MKLVILVLLLISVFAQNEIALHSTDYEDTASKEDKIKAIKCLVESGEEVADLVKLAIDIATDNFVGDILKVVSITKRVFKMLDNCKVLFCFQPTFEKCEAKNPQGCEKWGLIVYPKCQEGYTNWDCCVCASVCPEGFHDNGLYCLKPKAYGRGAGYAIWHQEKCEKENPQGCEKNGAMYYPKCRPGFHPVGCCICSPNCPSGWGDIGISCHKPSSYGRGVGYAVSFGLKCLEQRKKDRENSCEQKKALIEQYQQSVSFKYDLAQKDSTVYQNGLPDELKDLSNIIDDYSETCLNQPQQLSE